MNTRIHVHVLGWPEKRSFGFFYTILRKPNGTFGQPNALMGEVVKVQSLIQWVQEWKLELHIFNKLPHDASTAGLPTTFLK